MSRSINYTSTPWDNNYCEIIDVRSPTEFAEDAYPGAINLPVLTDDERARVGTIYKQVSPFEARKLGASLISRNISEHLSQHFANQDKQYSPLIYCWRGGQRSNSLAIILAQIGWRTTVLEGGYKTYRAYVRRQLATLPQRFCYTILCGLTGTGKTLILQKLAQDNQQVLDLEALANHRGSLLGQVWQGQPQSQPSQKKFETCLLQKLTSFNENQTVWVESESNKIGEVYLPKMLWQKMKNSACVEVKVPLKERVEWLIKQYPELVENPEFLKQKLVQLKSRYGTKRLKQWFEWIDQSNYAQLVEDLLLTHYDPAYQKSLLSTFQVVGCSLALDNLSSDSIADFQRLLNQMT